MKRILVGMMVMAITCIFQSHIAYADPDSGGPSLGKWEFTGKDDKGVVWKGTLENKKLDTSRFDANRFYSIMDLETTGNEMQRGVEAPSKWDPAKGEITFATGGTSYTALLSKDGKRLIEGKWTQGEKDFATGKITIKSTGVWSAKFLSP
jgi:hypothetical protein